MYGLIHARLLEAFGGAEGPRARLDRDPSARIERENGALPLHPCGTYSGAAGGERLDGDEKESRHRWWS
jgi:hypothetical protein